MGDSLSGIAFDGMLPRLSFAVYLVRISIETVIGSIAASVSRATEYQ